MKKVEQSKLWLNWKVKYCNDRNALISSGFKLKEFDDIKNVYVPYLWIAGLADKYSWLHTLRSSIHIPEDPLELTGFIESQKSSNCFLRDIE